MVSPPPVCSRSRWRVHGDRRRFPLFFSPIPALLPLSHLAFALGLLGVRGVNPILVASLVPVAPAPHNPPGWLELTLLYFCLAGRGRSPPLSWARKSLAGAGRASCRLLPPRVVGEFHCYGPLQPASGRSELDVAFLAFSRLDLMKKSPDLSFCFRTFGRVTSLFLRLFVLPPIPFFWCLPGRRLTSGAGCMACPRASVSAAWPSPCSRGRLGHPPPPSWSSFEPLRALVFMVWGQQVCPKGCVNGMSLGPSFFHRVPGRDSSFPPLSSQPCAMHVWPSWQPTSSRVSLEKVARSFISPPSSSFLFFFSSLVFSMHWPLWPVPD